jgi:hypothetical protein
MIQPDFPRALPLVRSGFLPSPNAAIKVSVAHSRPASVPGSGSRHRIIGQAVLLVPATWAELPALAMTAALSEWACVAQRWVAAEELLWLS